MSSTEKQNVIYKNIKELLICGFNPNIFLNVIFCKILVYFYDEALALRFAKPDFPGYAKLAQPKYTVL